MSVPELKNSFHQLIDSLEDEILLQKLYDLMLQHRSGRDGALDPGSIRQKAEMQLKLRKPETNNKVSEADILKLNHELEVHQIELELQNDELVIAKEKAEQAEEKYGALMDVSLTGVWTTDPFGNNTFVSRQWCRITGILPNEAKGNGWSDGLHPDDRESVFHGWKQAALNNKPYKSDFRFIRPDGCVVWVLCEAVAVKDNDGETIEWIGTITDITERKQAEEKLSRSKQLLEEIINNAPVRIFWKDRNLIYKGCNIEFAKDAGFSNPSDIIGKDDYQMGWQQQAELYRADDRAVIESGFPKLHIEEPQITPGGNTITLLTNKIPLRNEADEVDGVLGIYLDITQRKQTENALRENEERLRLAMKATNDVVWDWDIENDLQHWNEAGKKVFGWTEIVENKVNAAWWVERVHPDDRLRVEEGFFAVVKDNSGNTWQDEYRFRKADGTYTEVLDRGYVLRDNQGKAIRMIGAMVDISERKKAITALEESKLFANTIANSTPALLYLYDFLLGKNIWTNDVHKRFFRDINRNNEVVQFEDIVQVIHPDDINASVIDPHEFEKTGNIPQFDVELRIKQNDGWRWMRHLVTVFKTDDQGRPVQILGALFDIDAQKKTSDELHRHIVDLQLMNAINHAANFSENLLSIIDFIAKQLKESFKSHLLSVFIPDEERREMKMYGNTIDNDLVQKIEKITGKSIPRIVLKLDSENPFTEMEQSRKGLLFIGKKEVTNRLAEYLKGTPWPVMVQKLVKKLMPAICDILGYQSSAAVPMISMGKIVGYLELGSSEIMTERDLARIQSIADHFATFIVKNATERKLRESEERMASAFHYAAIGMAFVSPDGRWLKVNPAIPAMLGYTEAELLSKTVRDITHSDDHSKDLAYTRQMLEGVISTYQVEKRVYHKSGSIIWVLLSVSLVHDNEGRPLHFIFQIQDITELKNAFEELNKANEVLEFKVEERTKELRGINHFQKAILDNAPFAILTLDTNGVYQSINPIGESMTGYSADEVIGKMNPLQFHDREEIFRFCTETTGNTDPSEEDAYAAALEAIFQKTTEWHWIRKNGERYPVKISHSPLIGADGSINGHMGLILDIAKEKEHIDSLQKSEAENRAILKAVPDLMFRIHRDGTYLGSHSQNDSSLYVPKEYFVGKKVSEILPPGLAAESMKAIRKAFETDEVVQYEYSLPVNGKNGFYENRIICISDQEVLSIIRDITYRKETETALKMQSAAFESFALAIIITDIDGRIQWANSAFTRLTGYSIEEAIGKTPGELVKSDKQDKVFYENFRNTLLDKKVWSGELINRRKDGSLFYEEETITPVLDSLGNISNFIAIKIDISERKKLFRELADEKRRLADIIKRINAGTWEWNIQTGETIFNEQWAQILGYTLEEISPVSIETWMKFAHPDDLKTSGELLEKHFKGELDYYSFEARMKHKNGEWIWVLDRGRLHNRDEGGKPLLMSGTHLDITLQKQIEEVLVKAKNEAENANKAKSEFLSRMSHELRTPMNSILGFAQLIEMGELNQKQKKGVTHILNNGKHLLELINEVLDISGIEAGKQVLNIEPIQLAAIINEVTDSIHMSAYRRKISIAFDDSPANTLFVSADRLRLKQILINLLNNAIKYNKEGGSVTIQTTLQPADEKGSRKVRISIKDTGKGIATEDIGKLFQPFERIGADKTDTEGTGLGLMVVKRLTESMNGKVGVVSVVGAGSTFWIELPRTHDHQPEISQSEDSMREDFDLTKQTGTFLYIEDNVSNIELVKDILAEYYPESRLITSRFGKETIHLAKTYSPGLIFLDLDLPDIQGIEILQQLLADDGTKAIPVIIISADAMPFQVEKLMKAGANDYLTKPLDIVKFLKAIDLHIKN